MIKVLIVGGYTIHGMLANLLKGFEKIGCDVQHLPYMGQHEIPQNLKEKLLEYQPDFISAFIPERWNKDMSVRLINDCEVPTHFYDFDMPQESLRNDRCWLQTIASAFTFATSTDDSKMTKDFFEPTGIPLHWMPPIYESEDKPNIVQRTIDITILGNGYSSGNYSGNQYELHNRTETAFELRKEFGHENVNLVGEGWPGGWSKGPCFYYEQFDIYAKTKINIGTMIAVPPGKSRALNFRPTLTLGSGSFLLQEWHEGIDDCFTDGEEIVYWKTYEELLDKCSYYLQNEQERERIAFNGATAVQTRYSNTKWAAKLLEIANVISPTD